LINNISKDCELVWESNRPGYDGCIRNSYNKGHIYCYLNKIENGRIAVNWPKWCYLSVCFFYLENDVWEEAYDEEEPYYPGFWDSMSWSDYDWHDELKNMEEGMRAQVHVRRHAYVEIDEDGDMDFETWDNSDSCVWADVIKVNGKVVNYEEE